MIWPLGRCRLSGVCFVVLSILCTLNVSPISAAERAELAAQYNKSVVPFMKSYCIDCHSGDSPESGLDLEKYRSIDDVTTVGRKKWSSLLDMLVTGSMPPKDADQPATEELQVVLKWVQDALANVDCHGPVNPGRETIRRLNRIEYQNTIRDLLGIEFRPPSPSRLMTLGMGSTTLATSFPLRRCCSRSSTKRPIRLALRRL